MSIEIVDYTKPNGKTYARVMYQGEMVGQFFNRKNARAFVRNELRPLIERLAIQGAV